MKLSFFIFLLLAGSLSAQITDIGRLPAQNPEQIYEESSPVIISEDEFLIFFISSNNIINGNINDTLYSSRSTDGGKTWKDNSFIAELRETRSYGASYLTTLKTKTGRIVIAFTDWIRKKMAVTYSDDNGYNWSEFTYLAGSGNIVPYIRTSVNNLMLSELNDGKLILSFCSDVKKTAYYRESLDEGQTWSDSAYLFYSGTDIIKYISFVSLNGDSIAAFFELQGNLNNGIYKRISSDGGESWSTQTKLFDTGKVETRPRVIKISKDNMWMIFEVSDTLSHVSPFNDIYFTRSTYGVENWDTPQRFTSYAGKDDFVNASVINNKPFITFSSTRFTNIPQISYAVPGETVEMFKPPFIVNSEVFSDSVKQKTFVFNAKIIDDQSVDNAFLVPETDNPIILYDDGKHNDSDSSDNIFGNVVDLEHIPPSEMALIDVNKITLPINNKGIISGSYLTPSFSINTKISASDNEQQQISFDTILTIQYNSFNQFEEYNFLFSGGFLLSGYSNETLWSNGVASSMLLEDYLPGKVGSNRSDPLNKVYVVKKEDSPFGYSWRQWKNAVTLGAEFYDGDGDGIYNPVDKNWNGTWDKNEDMPMLLGDETAWCVYNDGLPGEMRRWGVNPQGIEVKQTVFATNKPGLENVMFIRYSILNTGMVADEMDSVYFGIWDDPDLGDWNDDLVGCDTLLNSGFVYNDSTDYYYGTTPPLIFYCYVTRSCCKYREFT